MSDHLPRSARLPPEGFAPIPRTSRFRELVGPVYFRRDDSGVTCGLYVDERHENLGGLMHGGMIATLADIALGNGIAWTNDPPLSLVTISLTVDYAGTAAPGDWVEARVDVQRVGRNVAFSSCYIWCGGQRIARASGTFAVKSRDRD